MRPCVKKQSATKTKNIELINVWWVKYLNKKMMFDETNIWTFYNIHMYQNITWHVSLMYIIFFHVSIKINLIKILGALPPKQTQTATWKYLQKNEQKMNNKVRSYAIAHSTGQSISGWCTNYFGFLQTLDTNTGPTSWLWFCILTSKISSFFSLCLILSVFWRGGRYMLLFGEVE